MFIALKKGWWALFKKSYKQSHSIDFYICKNEKEYNQELLHPA